MFRGTRIGRKPRYQAIPNHGLNQGKTSMKSTRSDRDTPVTQGVALSRKGRCRLTSVNVAKDHASAHRSAETDCVSL